MTNTQDKLKKLSRIEEKNRARARRYLEKVKKDGKKQLSAIISGGAYESLCRIRDKSIQTSNPQSFGQIIEAALFCYSTILDTNQAAIDNVNINVKGGVNSISENPYKAMVKELLSDCSDPVKETSKSIKETQIELFNEKPEHGTPDYKAWLLNEIDRLKVSGMGWVEITQRFNEDDIKSVSGSSWGRNAVYSFYKRNKKS